MRLTNDQRHILMNSMFYALYTGLGLSFIVPFALALGATNTYIGILSAMPFLGMILSQVPGVRILRYFSRRTIYAIFSGPSRLGIPLAALVPIMFNGLAFPALLVIIFLTYILDFLSEPTWASVAAEVVPKKSRGIFFGIRGLTMHVGIATTMLVGGFFLDFFPKENLTGFIVIFSLASVFGILSTFTFCKIKPKKYRDKKQHALKDFFTFKGAFGTFLYFGFLFNFGVFLVRPFIQVYILEDLALSYTIFTMAVATTTLGRLVSMVHIGKLADQVGDKKIAVLSGIATGFVPFAYLFIHQTSWFLIFPVAFIAGIAWAGIEVGVLNLLLDLSKEKNRGLRIAQYNIMGASAALTGPIIGGILADYATFFLTGIPLVFLLGTFLRTLPALLLLHIKEPRIKKKVSYKNVIRQFFIWHPAKEAHDSLITLRRVLFFHKRH